MIITKHTLVFKYIFKQKEARREARNMSFIANALAGIGSLFAGIGSQACTLVWWDEPKCPKSLIK